jgi:uncharacterized membrane protein YcfT
LGGISDQIDRFPVAPLLAVCGITGSVALAVLANKVKIDGAIQFLGQHSLEIYMAHVIASAGVRIALLRLADVSAPAPHVVLGTLAGLYFPIILALILSRIGFRFGFTLPKA